MKIIQGFHISVQGHRQNNYNNRNKYIGECVTAKLCVFINEDFLKAAKPPVPLLFNIKKEMVETNTCSCTHWLKGAIMHVGLCVSVCVYLLKCVVNTEQHLMLNRLKMHST